MVFGHSLRDAMLTCDVGSYIWEFPREVYCMRSGNFTTQVALETASPRISVMEFAPRFRCLI